MYEVCMNMKCMNIECKLHHVSTMDMVKLSLLYLIFYCDK